MEERRDLGGEGGLERCSRSSRPLSIAPAPPPLRRFSVESGTVVAGERIRDF